MFFDIILIFTNKINLGVDLINSLKSIFTQKHSNYNLFVTGNAQQLSLFKTVLSNLNQEYRSLNLTNQIYEIQCGEYEFPNLNQVLQKVFDQHQDQIRHKLIFLRVGDYISSDFLKDNFNFNISLGLHQNYIQPIAVLNDFKYVDSKQEVFDSKFILKADIWQKLNYTYIFNSKHLTYPFQFNWDLDLIKKYNLQFEEEIIDFNLKIAKFNLDYLFSLANLNRYIFPVLKINEKAQYFCCNQLFDLTEINKNRWWKIIRSKEDQLQAMGGKIWWYYRWLKIWRI